MKYLVICPSCGGLMVPSRGDMIDGTPVCDVCFTAECALVQAGQKED